MASPVKVLSLAFAAVGLAGAQWNGRTGASYGQPAAQAQAQSASQQPAAAQASSSAQDSHASYSGYGSAQGGMAAGIQAAISPPYNYMYEFPMPIPPPAVPIYALPDVNGLKFEYFESNISKFQKHIYPNLGPVNLVGYNATSPGPTYKVERGTHIVKRFTNYNDLSSVVHLHGSATRSAWDGWADDFIQPGQFKDYYYSNTQSARTLWYHDHADHHTSVDAYFGQNGFHIIHDSALDGLDLPTGNYDHVLEIVDKQYQANGDLISPAGELENFYGDIIHVNGQPWPFFAVEPRKYLFRVLNPGLSRPYDLYLVDSTGARQTFTIVGSDCGLFPAPVSADNVALSMGERYEIVIDFAPYANSNLTLMNDNIITIPMFENTDKVMRFVVGGAVTDTSSNSIPADTGIVVPFPPNRDVIDHVFNFERNSVNWTINGVVFDEVEARVLAKPQQGSVERWQLNYRSGPGVHPIHIHLVNFQIVSRTGGSRGVLPYESAGLKDVVLMEPGENIELIAFYGPWNGLYQFHCHNLIHEDHEMMDVMNVTALAALGYADSDLNEFSDSSNPKYQAKDIASSYYESDYIVNTLIPGFANSDAYRSEPGLLSAIDAYYTTAGYGPAATATVAAAGDMVTAAPINGGYTTAPNGQMTGTWTQGKWESWFWHGMGFASITNTYTSPTAGVAAVSITGVAHHAAKPTVTPAVTATSAAASHATPEAQTAATSKLSGAATAAAAPVASTHTLAAAAAAWTAPAAAATPAAAAWSASAAGNNNNKGSSNGWSWNSGSNNKQSYGRSPRRLLV